MMFTIVSGLPTDHEVFLLSRMREEWARSGDNSQAVASGLASTARVIAAAIMVCVFGSVVIADQVRILAVFGLGGGRPRRRHRGPDGARARPRAAPQGWPTGGCPAGSGGQSPTTPSSRTRITLPAAAWPAPGRSAQTVAE
jgi:hypothetical protein